MSNLGQQSTWLTVPLLSSHYLSLITTNIWPTPLPSAVTLYLITANTRSTSPSLGPHYLSLITTNSWSTPPPSALTIYPSSLRTLSPHPLSWPSLSIPHHYEHSAYIPSLGPHHLSLITTNTRPTSPPLALTIYPSSLRTLALHALPQPSPPTCIPHHYEHSVHIPSHGSNYPSVSPQCSHFI